MFNQKKTKFTIGIDARFYGPIGKGLGRYTQEVVDNIMKISSASDGANFDYVIFLSKDNFDEFSSDYPNAKKVLLNIRWYSLAEQVLMPFYIWRERIDLIHFPHFNVPIFTPTKFVVTIHDLILTHFPTLRASTLNPIFYRLKNLAYHVVIQTAIRRSQKIITVSQFTKDDILSKFKVKPDKIIITYEGIANLSQGRDSLFVAKLDRQETLDQYHIAKNFILYVGNAYPHKNLETLLRVFAKLHVSRPELRLVLVGKQDHFYSKVADYAQSLNLWQKNNINSPVIFPGYVPDAQLEVLYQEAKAYVFPSLYEGFGLPPLEAIARGCLVVSSDRASLPEILGAAAIYFNPQKEDDMLAKINLALDDARLKEVVLAEGKQLVKQYDWWECARETLEIYKQCL